MRIALAAAVRNGALLLACSLVVALGAGCATYEQELGRAEEHFTHDELDKSLAALRALEPDWAAFGTRDRARYCYLRGMSDYRIGFKADARHWLAIAAEVDEDTPGALIPSERSLVNDKLSELNQVIWGGDILPTEEAPHRPKKVETTGDTPATPASTKDGTEGGDAPKAAPPADDDSSPMPKKKPKASE